MAFDPRQFKQKKKRAVDPNAPPRPNLMSHDKVIREQKDVIRALEDRLIKQADDIAALKISYRDMQQSINQIINVLRRNK
jgi:preprotein translocase subunit SecA